MIGLIAALRSLPELSLQYGATHSMEAASAVAGSNMLQHLVAAAAIGDRQVTGKAALAQFLTGSTTCSGSTWNPRRCFGSSSNGRTGTSISSSSNSSLRADLASGNALGTSSNQQAESDTAKWRKSLLSKSGRFYETVTVAPFTASPGNPQQQQGQFASGYQLLLRKYPIKTPAKNLLVLPTYSLALAVAAEWEWLPKGKPVPHLMPLMSLAATAIDQPKERSKVIEHLLKYVHTDGACIRYEPGLLEKRQQLIFNPLLSWARGQLGWELVTSHSIFGATQSIATVTAIHRWLEGLDNWHLAAADQLITSSKSVVIAAALLHGRINVAEAVAAARVEEDFQLEDWGMVEAGHDLDIADTKSRIGAPAVFAGLLDQP